MEAARGPSRAYLGLGVTDPTDPTDPPDPPTDPPMRTILKYGSPDSSSSPASFSSTMGPLAIMPNLVLRGGSVLGLTGGGIGGRSVSPVSWSSCRGGVDGAGRVSMTTPSRAMGDVFVVVVGAHRVGAAAPAASCPSCQRVYAGLLCRQHDTRERHGGGALLGRQAQREATHTRSRLVVCTQTRDEKVFLVGCYQVVF